MAVYPVSIKGQSTLYIRATKAEITGEMRRLGIKNFTIQKNPVPKAMLSKVKLTSLLNIKKPTPSGAGKTAGAPNNPGMKPDFEAQSKRPDVIKKKKETEADKKKKQQSNKRGGSGNQTKKLSGATKPVNKKTVDNKQKIQNLAKKVKARMPNVSMSKILDTIRTQIRKRPLTAVAGAGGIGIAIGTIISALKPTKVQDATLTKNKVSQPKTMPFKSKTKDKNDKGSKPKPSTVSITIATPVSKPKRDKDTSKKKTDKGGSGMMFSLIVGGKGSSKDRFKEIAAEKTLEKKLGRRPDKKELIAYLKKN